MKSPLALVLVGATFSACTSTTKGEGPSGTSSSRGEPASNAQCHSTCDSKVFECSASAADAQAFCQGVCASSYTQQQLACFESASCAEFERASSLEDVCPP